MTVLSFVFFLIVRLGIPLALLLAIGTLIEKRGDFER
jgi:hypothetical protein